MLLERHRLLQIDISNPRSPRVVYHLTTFGVPLGFEFDRTHRFGYLWFNDVDGIDIFHVSPTGQLIFYKGSSDFGVDMITLAGQ